MLRVRVGVQALVLLLTVAMVGAVSAQEKKKEGDTKDRPKIKVRQRGQDGTIRGIPLLGAGLLDRFAPVSLAARPDVQEELKLTDEQKSKIQEIAGDFRAKTRAAVREAGLGNFRDLSAEERRKKIEELRGKQRKVAEEAGAQLSKVLTEEQNKRLRGIAIQARGAQALLSDDLAGELKLSDEQKAKIREVIESSRDKQRQLFRDVREGKIDRSEIRAKFEEIRKQVQKDAEAVLTDEQRQRLAEIKGEPFEFSRGAGPTLRRAVVPAQP